MNNFTKEIKPIKKNQIEIIELKNAIAEIKNSITRLSIKFGAAEERISQIEDRLVENIWAEARRTIIMKNTQSG